MLCYHNNATLYGTRIVQTDIQRGGQADWLTNRQTDGQPNRQTVACEDPCEDYGDRGGTAENALVRTSGGNFRWAGRRSGAYIWECLAEPTTTM